MFPFYPETDETEREQIPSHLTTPAESLRLAPENNVSLPPSRSLYFLDLTLRTGSATSRQPCAIVPQDPPAPLFTPKVVVRSTLDDKPPQHIHYAVLSAENTDSGRCESAGVWVG